MKPAFRALLQHSQAVSDGLPTVSPEEAAWGWLKSCLERNADSVYGKKYRFSEIKTPRQYQEQVPLVTYDDLKPYMERLVQGERDLLFKGFPVAFEMTGGSSSGAKLIPYSRESLLDFRAALLPWLGELIRREGLGEGSVYMAISPALRGKSEAIAGVPLGLSDGAYLGDGIAELFSEISAVPFSVSLEPSYEAWQMVTLKALLSAADLEFIFVWSPTFFLHLLDGLQERFEPLHDGLREDGEALSRLEAYARSGFSRAEVLWPRLKLVSCWRDASSAPYAKQLERRLGSVKLQGNGLLLTEGVVTVPSGDDAKRLAVRSGFFEFIDEKGRALRMQELVQGESYEIVMTTSGGLYRYRAGDMVCCEGVREGIPCLRFIGRGGRVSDLVGEKLTEAFVGSCMREANCAGMLAANPRERGYLLLTDESGGMPCDADAPLRLEACLCANPQYAYARKMGQLKALESREFPRLTARYCQRRVADGRRLGDIKIPALISSSEWEDLLVEGSCVL